MSQSQLSIDYYVQIFRNNPQRISAVKELLLKDFKTMEANILLAAKENDIRAMRAELHKMNPIVSNLKFSRMLLLLEKYQEHDQYSDGVSQLNEELRDCLSEIYQLLESQ